MTDHDQPPWLANQTAFDRFTDPIREQGTRVGRSSDRIPGVTGVGIALWTVVFVSVFLVAFLAPQPVSLVAFALAVYMVLAAGWALIKDARNR
jgi:hypothetical protein